MHSPAESDELVECEGRLTTESSSSLARKNIQVSGSVEQGERGGRWWMLLKWFRNGFWNGFRMVSEWFQNGFQCISDGSVLGICTMCQVHFGIVCVHVCVRSDGPSTIQIVRLANRSWAVRRRAQ